MLLLKGCFEVLKGVCSSTWINLIFQLHVLLPPHIVFGICLGIPKMRNTTSVKLLWKGFPHPISLCKAHFGFSSPFKGNSYKNCISAGSSRLGCAMELNTSIIKLSDAFFRPSLSNVFDIMHFSHTHNALDLLKLVKPLSWVSEVSCEWRYLSREPCCSLRPALTFLHSCSLQLLLTEVTRLCGFYTCKYKSHNKKPSY